MHFGGIFSRTRSRLRENPPFRSREDDPENGDLALARHRGGPEPGFPVDGNDGFDDHEHSDDHHPATADAAVEHEPPSDDPETWYGFARRSLDTIPEEPRSPNPVAPERLTPDPPAAGREPFVGPDTVSTSATDTAAAAQQRSEKPPAPPSGDPESTPTHSFGSLAKSHHLYHRASSFIENPVDFPDGGPHAWMVVLGAATAQFCTVGVTVGCVGAWMDVYLRDPVAGPSSTPATISWIPSSAVCGMFLSATMFNFLCDRCPPRWLLPVASALHVLLIFVAAVASSYPALFFAHFFSAVASGAVLASTTAAVQSWFLHRRGLALALAALGAPVGCVAAPTLVLGLVPLAGRVWAVRAVGFVALGLLAPACAVVRNRYGRRDGAVEKRRLVPRSMCYRTLKEPGSGLLVVAAVFVGWGAFVPLAWAVPQARERGYPFPLTVTLLPLFFLGVLAAHLAAPHAAPMLGRVNLVAAATMLAGVVVLAVGIPAGRSGAAHCVCLAVVGLALGCFSSSLTDLVDMLTPEPLRAQGSCAFRARMGVVLVVGGLGVLLGLPAAGALVAGEMDGHEAEDEFLGPQVFAGVSLVLAAAAMLAIRCRLVGLKFEII